MEALRQRMHKAFDTGDDRTGPKPKNRKLARYTRNIRDSHHWLARALACGKDYEQAARLRDKIRAQARAGR